MHPKDECEISFKIILRGHLPVSDKILDRIYG